MYIKFHYRFPKGNNNYRAVGECNIHFVFWLLITLHDTLYIIDNLNLYIDTHLNFIWKLIYFVYLAEPNIKEDNIGRDLGGTCIYIKCLGDGGWGNADHFSIWTEDFSLSCILHCLLEHVMCVFCCIYIFHTVSADIHVYMKVNVHVFDNIRVSKIFTIRNVYFF